MAERSKEEIKPALDAANIGGISGTKPCHSSATSSPGAPLPPMQARTPLVERICRAICKVEAIDPNGGEFTAGPNWTRYADAVNQEILAQKPDFDDWWEADGRFYDPDWEEVPWHDKRKGLAEYAWHRRAELAPQEAGARDGYSLTSQEYTSPDAENAALRYERDRLQKQVSELIRQANNRAVDLRQALKEVRDIKAMLRPPVERGVPLEEKK